MFSSQPGELKTTCGHWMPRSSICTMDLPTLRTIPFFTGMDSSACGQIHVGQGNGLARTYSVMALGRAERDLSRPQGGITPLVFMQHP